MYIDEKFKEVTPEKTVENIKNILSSLGIETEEIWKDSGIDNCFSLNLAASGGSPMSNGKGVSKPLARASAYAEFIERLQGGLFFYKYQDIIEKDEMYIQTYAPDVKYVTKEELIENGEWMDYLINEYGGNLSRKTIADFCALYNPADSTKIATLPFYSLFEDKYVDLPIGFLDQIYGTNGCCAGNTRNEAWVHALSEMMERRASLKMLLSGEAAPAIDKEKLKSYPVVWNIISQVEENGKFDIEIFDYSLSGGFPVVATRLINKETQNYRLNVAADPVFEIALQRTLTEMFQGKNIKSFSSGHGGKILSKVSDFPIVNNVLNQLESSNGVYTADFFCNEITCQKTAAEFSDNSNKTNDELLTYMLGLYRALNRPIYVRNFSYLGFQSYRFIVPGFSEAKAVNLQNFMAEALNSEAAKTLKNLNAADEYQLTLLLEQAKYINNIFSRRLNFNMLSGLPFKGNIGALLIRTAYSYANYKLGNLKEAAAYLDTVVNNPTYPESDRKYLSCLSKYLKLSFSGIEKEKVRLIIYKFFEKEYADRLYENLKNGNLYEGYLFYCDKKSCETCCYRDDCLYNECRDITKKAGEKYRTFTFGQEKSIFKI